MNANTNAYSAWTLLHTAIILGWCVLGTIFLGVLVIVISFFPNTDNWLHGLARLWGRSILWVSGIRVHASGIDRDDLKQSCIFMSNHQSNFDIPVLYAALPVKFQWLAKAELFKIPIFGRSMRRVGYISIDRSDRRSAFKSLARAAQTIRDGASVMIFPEGTRSKNGVLLPFKKGGFVLAVDAGAPIYPIIIRGTHEIMPKGRMIIRRRQVRVEFKSPIETAAYTRDTKDHLMKRVHAAIQGGLSGENKGGKHA